MILERAGEVGGTWRDNTYPGCACDVPSHLYSFSFAPNPGWSSTFSPAAGDPGVPARASPTSTGLTAHVRFGCEVEDAALGRRRRSAGASQTSAGVLRAALSDRRRRAAVEPAIPDIPGLRRLRGHASSTRRRWDHDHDLRGERVAVIGTGASAIQFVPADPARGRRSCTCSSARRRGSCRARTGRSRAPSARCYRRVPRRAAARCAAAIYWARELFALPMLHVSAGVDHGAPRPGGTCARQVPDPALRAQAHARLHARLQAHPDLQRLPAGARAGPTSRWSPTAIAEVTRPHDRRRATASRARGRHDHLRHRLPRHRPADRRARPRRATAARWPSAGTAAMPAHRGTTVAGFPNLFFLLGPNTGLGHNSVVFMTEAQVDYVAAARSSTRSAHGVATIEPRQEAAGRAGTRRCRRAWPGTVWTAGGCASWYLDASGPQHDAVAGLLLPLPPRAAPLRSSRARARAGRAAGAATSRWRHDPRADHRRGERDRAGDGRRCARADGARWRAWTSSAGDDVIACDVRDQDSVDVAVAEAIERLGGLDVLVNCAGIGDPQSAGERPDADAAASARRQPARALARHGGRAAGAALLAAGASSTSPPGSRT